MLLRLLLLFTLVPVVEVIILIRIGRHIGAGPTLLGVLAIGLLGVWLARHEGFRVLTRIRQELAAGRLPGDSTLDALLVLVAGVLMIVPGVLTDVAGLLLLIPPTRALVRNWLKRSFQARFSIMHFTPEGLHRPEDDFIDVEVRATDER
ncbi:MAG TPA: FxsA family protein [Phycisphaerae bacterium]|nr:FxsA family protein [Phycisphaerae bacterium]HOB74801.1 FxsA family protein [Phycisphaerae bacterium]HOJ54364.1 FxsA family protein [Phycisphaerae bacterium]HOL26835.1 FxsA family protein [Phycisphaerae bacterium]HPP19996.1 FxsA family protein [Phycisphaerae bacterium]